LADEAYQRGNARLFQGQTADAIKDFEEALDKNPKDPAIQRGLGLAYAQLGNAADAVRHLKAYLKAAPKANDRALVEKRIEQLRNH
jgi:regulator of sirC expression with transglutaminase-like and TPR domain